MVITVVGAALRFYALGTRSLWLDETLRDALATISWSRFTFLLWSSEPWMPLYHTFLRLWVYLGDSELLLRIPSAVSGIATIPVLYALGKRLFDRRTGEIAALLIALHTIHIEYSPQAVAYATLILFSALSSLCFLQAMARDRRQDWFAYAVVTALATYVHIFAILLVAAHCTALPFFRQKRAAERFLIAATLIAVMFTPLIRAASVPHPYGWRPGPGPRALLQIFCNFAGALPTVAGALIAGFYVVALRNAVGAFYEARAQAWASWGFLFSAAFVPLGLLLIVSFFKPLLVPRYAFVCLPAFVVLAAAGVARFPQDKSRIALGVFVAVALWHNFQYYTQFGREDWRQAVKHILAAAQPHDAVIIFPADGRMAYEYYAAHGSAGTARPDIVFPCWDRFFRVNGTYVFELTAAPIDDATFHAIGTVHLRLWILGNMTDSDPAFAQAFGKFLSLARANYPAVAEYQYQGLNLFLYSAASVDNKRRPGETDKRLTLSDSAWR